MRNNERTASTKFETPDEGIKECGGTRGKLSTRMKFPQISGDLRVRRCSAYLKIDVCSKAISNQKRFNNKRTVVITGERSEESPGRAKYAILEPDRSDNREGRKKRYVDRWRPVHGWSEEQVWKIIEKFQVNPHPCYWLGWGRCSCSACIFGSANQWASLDIVLPDQVKVVSRLEKKFGLTIQRKKSVPNMVKQGIPYSPCVSGNPEKLISIASSKKYKEKVILDDWKMPAGAFGESCGPT